MAGEKEWRVFFKDREHPIFHIEATGYTVNSNGDLSFYKCGIARGLTPDVPSLTLPPAWLTSFASGTWAAVLPKEEE